MSNIDTQPNPPPNNYDEKERKNQVKRQTKDVADQTKNRAEELEDNVKDV